MEIFSIFKPAEKINRPKEDYLLISKKYPIFVVADGVTLSADKESKYPRHSGAGELAKIFCKQVILEAEKRYENFGEKDLKEIFEIGNKKAGEYNLLRGRVKSKLNYWDFDFFAATTALLLIKDSKAFWWSLCDSGIVLFNETSKQIFHSPSCWVNTRKNLPKNWKKMKKSERQKILRRDYRNKIDENGKPIGYGVVTGEKEAEKYLNVGVLDLTGKNLAMVYTDGFEEYLESKEFVRLFLNWPKNLNKKLEILIDKKAKQSFAKFGLEKSLIAILLK